jgi:5-methylcytosine-specific restriction endonuclease McrA
VSEPPSDEAQVQFLLHVQRLLNEGLFTATYKYALLLALADIAVEIGDYSGAPVLVPISRIAQKYIVYYWRQAVPYFPQIGQPGIILQQNTDRQAAIVAAIAEARNKYGTIVNLQRDGHAWGRLVARVAGYFWQQPLWRLQRIGDRVLDFLYENRQVGARVRDIELRPGVAFCLRRFHGLLTQMVRNDWLTYIRKVNNVALGAGSDLGEFLFGSARADLSGIRPILARLQGGRCFYCGQDLVGEGDVDHFIPWSRYPVDLGHNFVAAHSTCNLAKGSRLAAEEHLARWARRNVSFGADIAAACDEVGMMHDLVASVRIAAWAYEQTAASNGLLWLANVALVETTGRWREALEAEAI